jgi:hypothetical protein
MVNSSGRMVRSSDFAVAKTLRRKPGVLLKKLGEIGRVIGHLRSNLANAERCGQKQLFGNGY